MQSLEHRQNELRQQLIDTLTAAFKNASGYATVEHGRDKWRETVTILVDGVVELAKGKHDE